MKQYCLTGESFLLALQLQVFESDVQYPSNTLMTVTVESGGFKGSCVFDIDVKRFGCFVRELAQIYQTLRGKRRSANHLDTGSSFLLRVTGEVIFS